MIKATFTKHRFILIGLLFIAQFLSAHPHTFLDMQIAVETSSKGIEGFTVRWKFDYVFSVETIYESDLDQDGQFSAEELDDLEYMAFNNLEYFHYFTFIYTNGKEFLPTKYEDFRAEIEGDTLVYYFFIPHQVAFSELDDLIITIYDHTFFCDVAFEKTNYLLINGAGKDKINIIRQNLSEVEINYDNSVIRSQREGAVYTGSYTPKGLFITNKAQ